MQKNVLISVVFFSFLGALPAQETTLEIQVIIDDGQEKHPGSVYLHHSRLKITYFTDSDGKVQIPAIAGDLLYISSDFYEDRSFLITEKAIEKRRLTLYLSLKPIVLKEAVIEPFLLTGNLGKDAKRAAFKDLPSQIYANLGIKEKEVPKPNPAGYDPRKCSFLKIENLIGEITGFNRKQRRLHNWEEKEKELNEIRKNWKDDFFTIELLIPTPKIREFIFFVSETTDLISLMKQNKWEEIESLMILKSEEYLSRLQPENPAE